MIILYYIKIFGFIYMQEDYFLCRFFKQTQMGVLRYRRWFVGSDETEFYPLWHFLCHGTEPSPQKVYCDIQGEFSWKKTKFKKWVI